MSAVLTEEQEMLRASARNFLEKECSESFLQALEPKELAYSAELWRRIAELGWLGLVLPTEFGGSGMGFVDLAVLSEELGRASFPGPYLATVVLGGLSVLGSGTSEQKSAVLQGLIEGKVTFAVVLDEPSQGSQPAVYSPDRITVRAAPEGEGFILNGKTLLVADAATATTLVVPARTGAGAAAENGITVFLVDGTTPGVSVTPLAALAGDNPCEVVFDGVRVPGRSLLGAVGEGWKILRRSMLVRDVMQSAFMLGAGEKLLQAAEDDYQTRTNAHEPARDPHVEEFLGSLRRDLGRCRLATYEAASRLESGDARPG